VQQQKGTSLITAAVREGILIAADDLVFGESEGRIISVRTGVQKVVIAYKNLLIGSAGLLEGRKIKYKFENWIADFIEEHSGDPQKRPLDLANAIQREVRATFETGECSVEKGYWRNHGPNDWIVHYVVAGYTEQFKQHYIYEVGAKLDAKGNGLTYPSLSHHRREFPDMFLVGEDEFVLRAYKGVEPQFSLYQELARVAFRDIGMLVPNIPQSLQEVAAEVVALVKVEAKFNAQKVGTTVHIVLIDRGARKTYTAIL